MTARQRLYVTMMGAMVAVLLNLAVVVPVFAAGDGFDGDEIGVPLALVALLIAGGVGFFVWRGRRTQTPQR